MCGCRASWRSETLRSVQNQLDFHPPRLLSNAVQLTCNSVSRNQECAAPPCTKPPLQALAGGLRTTYSSCGAINLECDAVGRGLGLSGGGTLKLGPGRLDIARADGQDPASPRSFPVARSVERRRSVRLPVRRSFCGDSWEIEALVSSKTTRRDGIPISSPGVLEDIVRLLARSKSNGPLVTRPVCRSVGPAKRRCRFPSYNSLRHTPDPLVTNSCFRVRMGGRPVRVSAEPDGLLNGINASGLWREPWGKDGGAKKAVPAVPTVVQGGFRVGDADVSRADVRELS